MQREREFPIKQFLSDTKFAGSVGQEFLIEPLLMFFDGRNDIVDVAKGQLDATTAFVREHNIVEVPDDPIEIIIMPEFQRGISVAYCDSPGPLDKGQATFYAVAPLPESWTDQQVESFLREYNMMSLQDLTIHEAMPESCAYLTGFQAHSCNSACDQRLESTSFFSNS